MIEVCNVSYKAKGKKTKNNFSLNNIHFALEDGYMMGLFGRNGAGKTTLLQTIYGMITPGEGEIRWKFDQEKKRLNQKNLFLFHRQAAYVGEEEWCFSSWSMRKNRELFARLYPQFDEQIYNRYLSIFSLSPEEEQKTYTNLSMGQRMLFQMAFVLARKPRLLLLDEPMANLDPVVKTDLMEALHKCVMYDGMGIILSTHLVDDISDLVDYIGILDQGRLTDFGDRESVLQRYGSDNLRNMLLIYDREEGI